MRDDELAALSAEFFEPEFNLETAVVMLGSPVSTEDLGGRTATYLRPDARSLARVEVFSVPPAAAGEAAVVEDVVLVLRGARRYSYAALAAVLGPGQRGAAPEGEDGEVGSQVEFPQHRTLDGVVVLRFMHEAGDAAALEEASGGAVDADEVRANEIVLRRYLPDRTRLNSATIPAPPGEEVTSAFTPPSDPGDLDEAIDTGAFLADLAWRIVRPDFDLARAYALVGHEVSEGPADEPGTALVVLQPRDPRVARATLTLRGPAVLSVRLDAPEGVRLHVALDPFCERLNAAPVPARGAVHFALEATRSRGDVFLLTSDPPQPIVAVHAIEVHRG